MSKQAFIEKSRKKKQTVKVLYVYKPIFVFVLSWFKWQRIGKLDRHASNIWTQFINTANLAVANEVGHIVGVLIIKLGNAEPCGNVLARSGTLVRIAGKCRPAAGNIDHLALSQNVVEILSKPDRPTVL